MFKTILATAATAALIAASLAAPAHADGTWWGKLPNGVSLNGVEMNGAGWFNGHTRNGIQPNGRRGNGAEQGVQAFALDGIELPASVR